MKNKILFFLKEALKRKVFWKNLMYILLLLFIPVISITMYFFYNTHKLVMQNVSNNEIRTLEKANQEYEKIKYQMLIMSILINNNDNITLLQLEQNYKNKFADSVMSQIETFENMNGFIHNIEIYLEEEDIFIDRYGIQKREDYYDRNILDIISDNKDQGQINKRLYKDRYPYLLTLYYRINTTNPQNAGYVFFNINANKLGRQLFGTTDTYRKFLIYDVNDIVLYCEQEYNMFSNLNDVINNTNYEAYIYKDEINQIFFMELLDTNFINEKLTENTSKTLLFVILILLGVIILAFIIASIVYRPIKELIHSINDISVVEKTLQQTSDLDSVNKSRSDEIRVIIGSIQQDKKSRFELLEEVSKRTKELNDLYIDVLQAQINPHFLYNTLDAINWVAYDLLQEDNSISKIVHKLSTIVRESQNITTKVISLKKEISLTRDYCDIIDFRYNKSIKIVLDVDDGLEEEKVLKLSIQPIIENAVIHGVRNKKNNALISINICKEDKYLLISVTDNGKGMSRETLENIRNLLHSKQPENTGHIGIRNVHRRMQLLFGEEYGLSVDSVENEYTKFTLKYPIMYREEL